MPFLSIEEPPAPHGGIVPPPPVGHDPSSALLYVVLMLFSFLDLDKVSYHIKFAFEYVVPFGDNRVAYLLQAEGIGREDLIFLAADQALGQRQFNLCHFLLTSSAVDGFHADAARLRNLFGSAKRTKRLKRGLDNVDGVIGTQRFPSDIANARAVENCAHRSAGDDAGTGRSRLKQHAACAEFTDDLVRNGRTLHGDFDDVPLSGFNGFSYGFRNLSGFAEAVADMTGAVADDDKGREPSDTAAFYRLGDTFGIDKGLFQLY